jgi:hypothetical protein
MRKNDSAANDGWENYYIMGGYVCIANLFLINFIRSILLMIGWEFQMLGYRMVQHLL